MNLEKKTEKSKGDREGAELPAATGERSFVLPWRGVALFCLVAAILVVFGFLYYEAEASRIKTEKSNELAAIGQMKVDQILRWRKERINDISRLFGSSALAFVFEQWISGPDDADVKKILQQRLEVEVKSDFYFRAFITDSAHRVLFSEPDPVEIRTEDWEVVDLALKSPVPVIGELTRTASGKIYQNIAASVLDTTGKVLAVAVLSSYAEEYLFPMIQSWPVPNRSAETLLIRRNGDSAIFLNDLRHHENTALVLSFPFSKTDLPAVQAAKGRIGAFLGSDYRGTEVLADLRPVPGTPWHLVSKVDTAEILAELRFRAFVIFGLVFMMILGVAGAIAYHYRIRRRAEKARSDKILGENEARYRSLFEYAPVGYQSLDEEGRFLDVNQIWIETLGYRREEVVGKWFGDFLAPEFVDAFRERFPLFKKDGKIHSEFQMLHKNGDRRFIVFEGRIGYKPDGTFRQTHCILTDITERKRTEETLRLANERYRDLVEGTDDLITIVDKEGRFSFVNHSAERFFGIKPKECAGRSAFDFIHPDDRERTKKAFEGWVTGKEKRISFENRQVHKSGQVFDMLWDINLYFDDSGEVKEINSFARDITDRKKMEEKIRQINIELEDRVRLRTADLTAAVKELDAFSYSVAHDLKAPLRAIGGFAGILFEDYASKLDDNGRRVIGVINDNVRNMGMMIEDLLKLAHFGRIAIQLVDIDLTTLVCSIEQELKVGAPADRAIDVVVKPLPAVRADLMLVRQIFTNLILNAIKFTARQKKAVIEIGSYDKEGERVYYVKDNGVGFDMKYADKLFGIFQRIHTQDEFKGTGIGLAIVKSAVLRHGGRVWAEGEVGQGATFYFTLPR
ncbi:MAG: PAS domain S-box protein [Candidatus Omnitrophota bacterium]